MALSESENEWLRELLDLSEDAGLNGFEETFMNDQRQRYKEYGADMRLSGKQWNIIFGVAEKLGHPLPEGKVYEPPYGRR